MSDDMVAGDGADLQRGGDGGHAGGEGDPDLAAFGGSQGFFQHVLWNVPGQSFSNLSGCNNGLSDEVTSLINIHSSRIQGFPSAIMVHNLNTTAQDAKLTLYDARTGTRIGSIVVPAIPPNASATFSVPEVESALRHTPATDQYHYNLLLEGDFYGYLQHIVYNTGSGLVTNATAKCAMAP